MTVDEAFWLRVLKRDRIRYEADAARPFIEDQTVLITGAGGTIGRALVAECLRLDVGRLIALDQSEYSLYGLAPLAESGRLRTVLGSVLDADLLDRLMEQEPALVLHAAAVKHVGFSEAQPAAAARVNVGGAVSVGRAGEYCRTIKRAVLISTDKAASPTTIMGMTKRVAESAWTSWGERGVVVRPVNVIGSSGSVGETFLARLSEGRALRVAAGATRMFQTGEETAAMILEATGQARAAGRVAVPSPAPAETDIQTLAARLAEVVDGKSPNTIEMAAAACEKAREVLTDEFDGFAMQLSSHIAVVAPRAMAATVAAVNRTSRGGGDRRVREILTDAFGRKAAA